MSGGEYLSIKETAERWGISQRRVQTLCSQGRIPGIIRVGYIWGIPSDSKKPTDARVKTGRYIKWQNKIITEKPI